MSVLLYGFEPFLDLKENPSEQIVRSLSGKEILGNKIETLVLPVESVGIENALISEIKKARPDLVMGLGLYQGLPKLGVTKIAINFLFSQIKDSTGRFLQGRIDEKLPDGIFMSIPSEGLVEYLNKEGVPAMLLMATADAYVCNLAMFVAARESKEMGFGCGFIHLPFTEGFTARNPARNVASMNLATMTKGVEFAIKYCLKHRK